MYRYSHIPIKRGVLMYYVYKCTKCDKETTIERSIYCRDDRAVCVYCGKEMKRIITPPSVLTSDGYKQ